MEEFNFAFSFFGLILGFTLIEVLSGLVAAVKSRTRTRIGWLTPMLAIFVMMDLLSFWSTAWGAREGIAVTYGSLLLGLAMSSFYYLAASLIFPADSSSETDLDLHYLTVRRPVLGGLLVINCSSFPLLVAASAMPVGKMQILSIAVYVAAVVPILLTRSRIVNGCALGVLIGTYLFWAVVA